jgi:hypothetical protein
VPAAEFLVQDGITTEMLTIAVQIRAVIRSFIRSDKISARLINFISIS